MPFKYVDAEQTSIALDDNKLPIWQHEDGKEVGVNFGGTLGTIRELTAKEKEYKAKLTDFEKRFKDFEGIEPEKARKALDLMNQLDEGKLVDSGKRDEAIKKAIEARDAEWSQKHKSIETALKEASQKMEEKEAVIYNLMVSQKFGQSSVLKDKTMTPDVAEAVFARNFKVENVDGAQKPVGYLNNEKIYSLKNPGKIADFDEAFGIIWENYPHKNNYMKDIPGGSGSQGGHSDHSGGKNVILRGDEKFNPLAYKRAVETAKKQGGEVIFQ